ASASIHEIRSYFSLHNTGGGLQRVSNTFYSYTDSSSFPAGYSEARTTTTGNIGSADPSVVREHFSSSWDYDDPVVRNGVELKMGTGSGVGVTGWIRGIRIQGYGHLPFLP